MPINKSHRLKHLENQILILTEDFQKALTIGYNQDMTLNSFKKQLQKLDSEVALLRTDNSTLGMFRALKIYYNGDKHPVLHRVLTI